MPSRPRRALAFAVLNLLVAAAASIAAKYQHEPPIGLRTGRGPQVEPQELWLEPGTAPPVQDATATDPPTTAPTTTAPAPRTSTTSSPPPTVPPTDPVEVGGVYGVVVDHAGRPITGICVGTSEATDTTGRFAIGGLDPGPYEVDLAPAGPPGCFPLATPVERPVVMVAPGEWTGPVVFVVEVGDALDAQ